MFNESDEITYINTFCATIAMRSPDQQTFEDSNPPSLFEVSFFLRFRRYRIKLTAVMDVKFSESAKSIIFEDSCHYYYYSRGF